MSPSTIAVPGSVQRETETKTDMPIQQQQEIMNLAYALWQQRGCPDGSSQQDWIEAERRVRGDYRR